MAWEALVRYDEDGTTETTLRGDKISAQLFADRRALIKVFSGSEVVEMLWVSACWSIRKVRTES